MSLRLLAWFLKVLCVAGVCTTITPGAEDEQREWHDCESNEMAFLHESLSEEKGGIVSPLSITSELNRFKSCYTQDLSNLRGFDISVPDRISGQSVKHLQHLIAVLSNAKHTDCGFFGHDKRKKVCRVWVSLERISFSIRYSQMANVTG